MPTRTNAKRAAKSSVRESKTSRTKKVTADVPVSLARLNAEKPRRARVNFERRVPFGQGSIDQYTLGNGLRIYLMEDHAAPVASFHTWYRVGSRHEIEGKTGLAHLFEHLMFNETKNLPAGMFDRKLEAAGAHTNAATYTDWTYYYEDVPSTQLPVVVRLEADRMQNLVLREPQVRSEKEVVANERRFRVEDDVDGAVNELLWKHAFDVHPYHHPTIGWMEDILNFTTRDCRAFYKTFYAPNNATIVAVGDFSSQKILALVQKAYGEIPAQKILTERVRNEPDQAKERRLVIEKPTPTGKVAIGFRGPALADRDHHVMSVLSEALFGGRSARLYRRLVTERELATDVLGSVSAFAHPGLWEIYGTAREGVASEQLLAAIDEGLDDLRARPITDEERERAIARTELSFLQSLETVGGRAEQIGFYDTVIGDPAGAMSRLDAMRSVTTDEIARAVDRYVRRERRTVIIVNPSEGARNDEEAA
jgi:zinc protease